MLLCLPGILTSKFLFAIPLYLLACLSVCMSAWPSVCLHAWPSVCLHAWPSVCLHACLTVFLFACLIVYLHAWLSVRLHACLTVCLSVCMPAWPYVCLCTKILFHRVWVVRLRFTWPRSYFRKSDLSVAASSDMDPVPFILFLPSTHNVHLQQPKTLKRLVHAGLFWCFHNPPNSDVDQKSLTCIIINYAIFWHVYIHGWPRFMVSSEGLL